MAGNTVLKRFELAIDLKRPVAIRPFEVVEGDTGNVLEITLTDDGSPVDLTGMTVAAVFSTANGISVQRSDESITIDGNELTIRLYAGSFAPGLVECELQIYSTANGLSGGIDGRETLVTTAKFNFSCRRAILNGDSIESTPQFPLLTELCAEVSAAELERQQAEAAREQAETARASAENARAAAETAREASETARVYAETMRANAESARAAYEASRRQAENQRAAAEAVREEAEAIRAAAEEARETAEAAREEAVEELLETCGTIVSDYPPDEYSRAHDGRLFVSRSTGETFVCFAGSGPLNPTRWKRIGYDDEWKLIKSIQLTANSPSFQIDTDEDDEEFLFDELRLVIVGGMHTSAAASIYVNNLTRYFKESTFLAKDPANIGETMTVMRFYPVDRGFIRTERETGGIMDSGVNESSSRNMQANFLNVGAFQGYTAVRAVATGSGGSFLAGTKVYLEGRNVWK